MPKWILAAAAALAAYSWLAPARSQDVIQTVLIGVAGPSEMPRGNNTRDAVEFAIGQANARGLKINGRRIVLQSFVADDKNDVNLAVIAARAMVAAGVVGVVGHLTTDASIAASKVYHEAGIPLLAPTAASKDFIQGGYDNVFQIIGHSDYTSRYLAQTATRVLGGKRIMLVDNDTVLGRALAQGFTTALTAAGGRIVESAHIGPRSSDFNAITAKISAATPDVVMFAGVVPQSIAFALRWRQLNMRTQLLLAGGALNPEFPQGTGQYPDGTLMLVNGIPADRVPDFKKLESQYKEKYESPLIPQSWFAYDAVGALVEAMKRTNSLDPKRLGAALHQQRYVGQSGTLAFLENGSIESPRYTLYRAEQGRWKVMEVMP